MKESKLLGTIKSFLYEWSLPLISILVVTVLAIVSFFILVKHSWLSVLLAVVCFAVVVVFGIKHLLSDNANRLPASKALAFFSFLLVIGIGSFAAISTVFLDPSTAPIYSDEPGSRFLVYVRFYLVALFDMLPGIRFVETLDLDTFMKPRSRGAGVMLVLFRGFVLYGLLQSFAVWRESRKNRHRFRNSLMKYMVIETFKAGMADKVYERFNEKGRMLPDGVYYLDSWLSNDRTKCFQLMEADRSELIEEWIAKWDDLTEFEVVLVQDSLTNAAQQGGCT
jgi:hypothetical protein